MTTKRSGGAAPYVMRPDPEIRARLVAEHIELARAITGVLKRRLPPCLSYEDLLQSALLGLLQAADRFDPEAGCSFRTYASHVIRGAIIDYARAAYPMPGITAADQRQARCDVEARAEARMLLERLSERERLVVTMRMRGESYRAISARIGVHHTRALQIFERAIRRLREIAA